MIETLELIVAKVKYDFYGNHERHMEHIYNDIAKALGMPSKSSRIRRWLAKRHIPNHYQPRVQRLYDQLLETSYIVEAQNEHTRRSETTNQPG